ncbi:putative ABC transport system permease protein [Marinobacter persicus]|uniref:Putative ABC transport system permease protein n=1 Tax=Marinobacter persicus TaxID=930118 RepID=A0A1I3WLC6_9GAMM|nr:ABC transporter permease [Marinobacter persicus]GHD48255.1 permease [Marinobacter persicus]SFK08140.1 putative ABC transport system permease protein [Marinobacter persicus]
MFGLRGSVLHTKLKRELWQIRGQVLAIALVIAGGIAVCLLSVVNYTSLDATRQQYYQEQQFADVFVSLKRAPRHLEQQIGQIPGVRELSARVEGAAKLEVSGFTDPVSARLVSLPPTGQPAVNRLHLRQGRLPDPGRHQETVIIGSFADAHDLQPGDTLSAVINGRKQTLTVVGIAESPEFIYVIPPGGMLPDYQRYGVLWLSREALASAMDLRGAFNSLVLQTTPDYPVADVIDRLDRLLGRYGSTGAYAREDQFSHRFLSDELEQLKVMAIIFPTIFMGVAMFLLNVVIGRLISTQRDIVAVLKAFGYSNRQIAWHYSQLVLTIATIGLLIGTGIGLWLGRALGELYMDYYRFPALLFRINPLWLVLLAILSLSVAWLGGWRAIRRAAALPPAEAMQPEGPARYNVSRIERLLSRVRFRQPSRMIVRQLARRPGRTALSIAGIAMATAIVVVGNFQFSSVELMVHTQFARVQKQDLTVTLTDPVNQSALYSMARQPGVLYTEGRRSVAVELVSGHRTWRTALTGLPENARLQFVVDSNLNNVAIPASGLLLTDFLARRLNVSPGDSLQVQVLEQHRPTLTLPVAGVTSEFLGVGAYMNLEAMNRALREGPVVNQVLLNLQPEMSDSVYQRLQDTPRVMATNQRRAMLDSFFDTLAKTFLTYTFIISLLGGIIAFGVIYNTARISLAERARDLASLRVLGYNQPEVAHILLGELALLLVLGIPLGWAFGAGLGQLVVTAMQTELYRVPLIITGQTLALAACVVIASALVSGFITWLRLRKLDLVAVLKTRE